jgi:hypothetical protein
MGYLEVRVASLYDEKVLGAKDRIALARKLQEKGDNIAAGQMVSGWYVPNTGGAALGALQNIIGAYQESGAREDLDKIEREKTAAIMRAQESYGVPATEEMALAAGKPAKDPSIMSRLGALVRLEDQPQATPAQPMAHNVAQNATPEQRRSAMISLMGVDPTQASNLLKLQELDVEQAKAEAATRWRGMAPGYHPEPSNVPGAPPIMVGNPTLVDGKIVPYSEAKLGNEVEKKKVLGEVITPVEQHSMNVQDQNLALAYDNANRAAAAAARADARAETEAKKASAKEVLTQYTNENPNYKDDLKTIQKATDTHERLVTQLKEYKKVLDDTPLIDRGNPAKNTRLKAAYQAATFAIRDPQLLNTGVMTGGDKEMLSDVLPDPTSFKGLVKGSDELTKGIDQVVNIANTNTSAVVNNRAPAPPPGAENAPIFKKIDKYRTPPATGGALGGVSPVPVAPVQPPVQQQAPMQPPVQPPVQQQAPVQQKQKFTSSGW